MNFTNVDLEAGPYANNKKKKEEKAEEEGATVWELHILL